MSSYARVPVFRPSNKGDSLLILLFLFTLIIFVIIIIIIYKGHPFVLRTWLINNTASSTNIFIVYKYSVNNMSHAV
jgi:hypothetical protein